MLANGIGQSPVTPASPPRAADPAADARQIGASGDIDAAARFVQANPDQRAQVEDGMLAAGNLNGITDLGDKLRELVERIKDVIAEQIEKAAPVDGVQRSGFATPDAAAKAALEEGNPQSIRDNLEYGGLIYRSPDGTYGYTRPITGTGASFSYDGITLPPGAERAATFHTHADYSVVGPDGQPQRTSDPSRDDYNSDNFSDQDLTNAEARGIDSYLGTPSGTYRKYDVETDQLSTL